MSFIFYLHALYDTGESYVIKNMLLYYCPYCILQFVHECLHVVYTKSIASKEKTAR